MNNLIQEHETSFNLLYKLYSEFNAHTNISSITNKEEVYEKHFTDSLRVIPYISSIIESTGSIIDIGTGGGFPALPLAIVLPQLRITAIDSVGKKIKFLELVKKELGLKNLEPIACRAEELAQSKEHREQYDVALSRAVAELRTLLEYSIPFVKVQGKFIAYKKQNIQDELASAANAIHRLGCSLEDTVEYNDKQLLIFIKSKKTSNEYPRTNQQIKREPL